VVSSEKAGYWLNEKRYEVQGDSVAKGGPMRARLTDNGGGRLFKGFCFHFQSPTFQAPFPSKSELQELVKRGGGKVISRLPLKRSTSGGRKKRKRENKEKNAEKECEGGCKNEEEEGTVPPLKNVVICDPSWTSTEEVHDTFKRCGEFPVSVEWILSCISHFQLLPLDSFRLPHQ